jgi:hypothetical protein
LGARPNSRAKNSDATSLRIRARRVRVELGVGWTSGGEVGGDVTALEFLVELGRAVRPDGEGTAEPAGLLGLAFAQASVQGGLPNLVGERMMAVAEEGLHLRLGDRVASGDPVEPLHARAHPHAGRLALLLVVGGEPGPDHAVLRGDLSGEVVVAGPGRDLLQADRHHSPPLRRDLGTLPKPTERAIGTRERPQRRRSSHLP